VTEEKISEDDEGSDDEVKRRKNVEEDG